MRLGWMLLALSLGCGGAEPQATCFSDPQLTLGGHRQPLYHVGVIFHHQVALDLPGRAEVLIGQMRFPEPESYQLHAQTPFGLDLFELSYAEGKPQATITADALSGVFPAEALAGEIAWIYLKGCSEETPREPIKGALISRCGALTERLDPKTLLVTSRTIIEGARRIEVRYEDYVSFEMRWFPKRITLSSGDTRVEIHLDRVESEVIDAPSEPS